MTEPKITEVLAGVQDARNAIQAALALIGELRAEDPAYQLPIQARFMEATRALDQTTWPIWQALRHLNVANEIENRGVA